MKRKWLNVRLDGIPDPTRKIFIGYIFYPCIYNPDKNFSRDPYRDGYYISTYGGDSVKPAIPDDYDISVVEWYSYEE